jgi:hypothetical protein
MSDLDNLRKVEGRVRARGRALRATKVGKNSATIKVRDDNEFNEALLEAYNAFGCKSMYKPRATKLEKELLKA